MIRTPNFFALEQEAPLLQLNKGFLLADPSTHDVLFERVNKWPELLGIDSSSLILPESYPNITKDKNLARIFVADAERTFRNEENRQKMIRLLNHVSVGFGGYHQGLGFAASFLLLLFDEKTAIAMLTRLNSSHDYIPGYWQEPAVPFARDAYVFHELLGIHFPKLKSHFEKLGIVPNMYATKWFVGLCVHVLPFEALFKFMEFSLKYGYKYLMAFSLELVSQLEVELIGTENISVLIDLLKLDGRRISTEKAISIVEGALRWEPILEKVEWEILRKEVYDKHLKARLEAAERAMKRAQEEDSDDEIVFSDEEEDEEEKEKEEEDEDEDEAEELADKLKKVNV